MRKIIAGMFITLDGVVEAPEKWNPPYYDDELNQDVMPLLAAAGTHLYGRRSYELFRGVFTGPAAPPHAGMMTATPKVVVSTTLTNPEARWHPGATVPGRPGTALKPLERLTRWSFRVTIRLQLSSLTSVPRRPPCPARWR